MKLASVFAGHFWTGYILLFLAFFLIFASDLLSSLFQVTLAALTTIFSWTIVEKTVKIGTILNHSHLYYGDTRYRIIAIGWVFLYLKSSEGKISIVLLHRSRTKFEDGFPRLRYEPFTVVNWRGRILRPLIDIAIPAMWLALAFFVYSKWPIWNNWSTIIFGAIVGLHTLIFEMFILIFIQLELSEHFHLKGDAKIWYCYKGDGNLFGVDSQKFSIEATEGKNHFISWLPLILGNITPCKSIGCNHERRCACNYEERL